MGSPGELKKSLDEIRISKNEIRNKSEGPQSEIYTLLSRRFLVLGCCIIFLVTSKGFDMSEITPEKTHEMLEKLAEYVVNELPTKKEMHVGFQGVDQRFKQVDQCFEQVDRRFKQVDRRLNNLEQDVQDTKQNVRLILNGMDAQAKGMEILRTEQAAMKSGLARLEKRVDAIEEKG